MKKGKKVQEERVVRLLLESLDVDYEELIPHGRFLEPVPDLAETVRKMTNLV